MHFYSLRGNEYEYNWEITDEIFCDSDSLILEQITALCNKHNSELVKKGFDKAILDAANYYDLNPKVLLATLKWEQGWGKNNINKAFGVDAGNGGNPIEFSPKMNGGVMAAAKIYRKNFDNALENYVEGKNTLTQIYGQDKAPYNEPLIESNVCPRKIYPLVILSTTKCSFYTMLARNSDVWFG